VTSSITLRSISAASAAISSKPVIQGAFMLSKFTAMRVRPGTPVRKPIMAQAK
jgi:hypothetical protein